MQLHAREETFFPIDQTVIKPGKYVLKAVKYAHVVKKFVLKTLKYMLKSVLTITKP